MMGIEKKNGEFQLFFSLGVAVFLLCLVAMVFGKTSGTQDCSQACGSHPMRSFDPSTGRCECYLP